MKIAVVSSLQGYPEEISSDTPTDTTRIARYIAERLQDALPQAEVELYDRTDYPGMGDCYLQVRKDVIRWGADIAVHIHQDAYRPGMRGWSVLYCQAEALRLAEYITAALASVPSPRRGLIRRCDVAVLKPPSPPVSVLVECGFYTSPEDEAVGTEGWGGPVVRGVLNYLKDKWGIAPSAVDKEVDVVPKIVVPKTPTVMDGNLVYHVPAFHRDWWLDIGYEGPAEHEITIWINHQTIDPKTGKKPAARKMTYRVPGTTNPVQAPGLHIRPCIGTDPQWVVLSIHCPVEMTIFIGP